MTLTHHLSLKTVKVISIIAFSLIVLIAGTHVSNVYAQQQGGSAISGPATGGPGSSGETTCSAGATCNFYGGSGTSGRANGGPATGTGNTGGSPTNGQASGEPDSLGSTRGAFLYDVIQGEFSGPDCKVYSLNDPTEPESHYIMYSGTNNGHYLTLNIPHRNGYSKNDMARLSHYCFELNAGYIYNLNLKL